MLKSTHSRTVRSVQKPQGYFVFELVLSALMIAAIVVLAFPTYQDFTPEIDVIGEIQVPEQAQQLSESAGIEDSGNLSADQQDNRSGSSPESSQEEESTS